MVHHAILLPALLPVPHRVPGLPAPCLICPLVDSANGQHHALLWARTGAHGDVEAVVAKIPLHAGHSLPEFYLM